MSRCSGEVSPDSYTVTVWLKLDVCVSACCGGARATEEVNRNIYIADEICHIAIHSYSSNCVW